MSLYHLLGAAEWQAFQHAGVYAPPSLAADGFVHLSFAHQVAGTATYLFRGRADLILLELDDAALPEVRVEDLYGHGAFPHAYGPIARAAVLCARTFPPKPDGSFADPML